MQANVSPGSLPDSGPLVSIVLPSYNGERFLVRSIESCLNQTHRNIELILVDDGSVDSTWSIMRDYAEKDKRVIALRNAANSHIAASLNKGFATASGKYHSWTSDDNYYEPSAIEVMLNTLVSSGSDIVFAGIRNLDDTGEYLNKYVPDGDIDELMVRNIVSACFLYRKDVFGRSGGYDVAKPLVEDYCFWLTALKNDFIFLSIPIILYNYTVHNNSLTYLQSDEIRARHFLLLWDFRALAAKISAVSRKLFCRKLYADSMSLGMKRFDVFLFSFPSIPKTCMWGEIKRLLRPLKKHVLARLSGKFPQRIISCFEYLHANSPFAFKVARTVPDNPKIGFAVLSHERPEYLQICLDTLFASDISGWDITFLIHDDGSTDQAVRRIIEEPRCAAYKVVRCYKPKGHNSWGAAFNSAMSELRKLGDFDILGSCDSDALFHPQWLQKTLPLFIWAKKHHKHNILGPFSPFNSSDIAFHKSLGVYDSPFGQYIIKERMGALVYFLFIDDLKAFGTFDENRDDETIKTKEFVNKHIRNFSSSESYVEHIGKDSILNLWRPQMVPRAVHGLNLVQYGWPDTLAHTGTLGYFRSVASRSGMFPRNNSQRPLDIVIPATEKDLPTLALVIKGVRRNLAHPIGRIFVVSPITPAMRDAVQREDALLIDERKVLPLAKQDIQYTVSGTDRSGWLLQQFIKLNADSLTPNEHFLVIDADTVLVRRQVFEEENKTILLISDEYHQPYYKVFMKLLGFPPSCAISFVSHMMSFESKFLRELRNILEERSKKLWWESILSHMDKTHPSGFSEFEFYGHWMLCNHPEIVKREYFMNCALSRDKLDSLERLEGHYGMEFRSVSFHSYIN